MNDLKETPSAKLSDEIYPDSGKDRSILGVIRADLSKLKWSKSGWWLFVLDVEVRRF
jgi:hypothetical protein